MEPNLEKARGDRKKQLCAGVPSPHMAISSSATHHHSNWQLTARRCWQGTAAQVQHCALNSTRRRRRKGKRERETSTESVYLSRSIYRASHTSFWRAPEPNLAPVTGIGTSVLRRPAVFTGQQQRRKLSHRLSLTRTHHCDGQVIRVLNVLLQSSANSVHVWHCPTE